MTIAIIAPEKFAFQDLVCVEIAYRFRAVKDATLVVEPKSGEDGTLTWFNPRNVRLTAEIQIKGAGGVATLEDLATYLSHFPERSGKSCLFERLLNDPDRRAVFVLSARCDDQLLPFLNGGNDDTYPIRAVSGQIAQLFFKKFLATHLISSGAKVSKLAKGRRRRSPRSKIFRIRRSLQFSRSLQDLCHRAGNRRFGGSQAAGRFACAED